MFCPNCGKKIADGSKFCGSCGANLVGSGAQKIENIPAEMVRKSENGMEMKNELPTQYVQPKKKKKEKNILLILIVILVIIGIAFAVKIFVLDGRSGKDAFVYTSDGKYVYYFTRYDSSEGVGTLCRAEYGKLKENSNKNDKYIDIIASNVKAGFSFFENGMLTYQNKDNTLYLYDGKETTQVAKNVFAYYMDGNRIIYETSEEGTTNTLYGISLDNGEKKIKLATNYISLWNEQDFDNIFYVNENGNLYVVGFDKKAEQIAKNVEIFHGDESGVYFTVKNGDTLSLYDYVNDNYAAPDEEITNPDENDYEIPAYTYEEIADGDSLNESDYEELYTSCTQAIYWLNDSYGRQYSMEEALELGWREKDAEIRGLMTNFIQKYADSANDDGYILVDDDIKKRIKGNGSGIPRR